MDKSNNKKRLLALIEILKKQSDENKHLKLEELVVELNKQGIEINNRKTLYDDFKILNEFGINVEYENGYYLLEAPFNLSEIKIILDSINSLKNLDNKLLTNLNNKLYSFISLDDETFLNSLQINNKHKDAKLLQKMEDVLSAIRNSTSVIVKTIDNRENEIFPCFLQRENDYYYFYYHYPLSDKLYHYRFDNITNVLLTNNVDEITISRSKIISLIEESSKSFVAGKSKLVQIELLDQNEKVYSRFLDDFPTAIRTKNGFSLKADINNIFFGKLVNYGNKIKILDKDVSNEYKKYLNEIIKIYK